MDTIEKLLDGYRLFHKQFFEQDNSPYQHLRDGQSPGTLFIACSDSRTDPAIITHSDPGELFVIRNVANMVPPYQPGTESLHGVSAALEFGVCHLEIKNIIVMGHSGCAGIRALCEGISPPNETEQSFIEPWVNIGSKARNIAATKYTDKKAQYSCCEQEAIKLSIENLMSFPWIKNRVSSGHLQLHGWYFCIEDGSLLLLDKTTNEFSAVPI